MEEAPAEPEPLVPVKAAPPAEDHIAPDEIAPDELVEAPRDLEETAEAPGSKDSGRRRKKRSPGDHERRNSKVSTDEVKGQQLRRQKSERGGVFTNRWAKAYAAAKQQYEEKEKAKLREQRNKAAVEDDKVRSGVSSTSEKARRSERSERSPPKEPEPPVVEAKPIRRPSTKEPSSSKPPSSSKQSSSSPPKPRHFLKYMNNGQSDPVKPLVRVNTTSKSSAQASDRPRRASTAHSHGSHGSGERGMTEEKRSEEKKSSSRSTGTHTRREERPPRAEREKEKEREKEREKKPRRRSREEPEASSSKPREKERERERDREREKPREKENPEGQRRHRRTRREPSPPRESKLKKGLMRIIAAH